MKFSILFLIAVILFTACHKYEQLEINPTVKNEKSLKIYYDKIHNMMVFESMDVLKSHLDAVNKGEQVLQTEKGFISLSTILKRVVKAEMALENEYEKLYKDKVLTEKELQEIESELNSKPLKKATKQLIDKGIIEIIKTDNTTRFDLTTCAPYYALVLNKDGMMKVGDIIYKYSSKQLKTITDGDFNKIALLKNVTKTDTENKIEVINVTSDNKAYQIGFYYDFPIHAYGKRIVVSAFLTQYSSNGLKKYIYTEKFYCQKENWLGNWVTDSNAEVYVDDYLQVKKDGVMILDHSAGVRVYSNTSCYSGSIIVLETSFNNSYYQCSANNIKWTRSGGPSGFSYSKLAHSVNW